ncbi:MAG: PP2C family protein-serine/threonine phosphatase [Sphingobacteriaceae bacterium]
MKKITILFLLLSLNLVSQVNKHVLDSLFNLDGLDSAATVDRLKKLSWLSYGFNRNLDTADLILNKARTLLEKVKLEQFYYFVDDIEVANLIKRNKYAEAYDLAQAALKKGKTAKTDAAKIWSYDPLLTFYSALKSIDKKISTAREKLKIARDCNDSMAISNVSYKLAYDLYTIKQLKESRDLFLDAYNFRPMNKRKTGNMAEYIGWAGNISHGLKDYNASVRYRLMAAEIGKALNDKLHIGTSYRYIGGFYASRNMKDSALYYFDLSLRDENNRKTDAGPFFNHFFIASELYNGTHDAKLAEKYLTPVLDNEKTNKYSDVYYWASELGTKVYADLHNFDRLAYCTKWYFKLKDSLDKPIPVSEENISMKHEYELQLKEKEANTLREVEKRKSENVLKNVFIVFSLAAIILLVLVFRNYREKKKAHEEVSNQNIVVERKNKEILDSITYAKRLQSAILPPQRIVKEYLKDSFILYKPKDIVAGDFYWMEQKDGAILFAAADCTGHGVPGALVSVICNNGLNRSVREYGLSDPGEILDKTREIIIQEFEKSDDEVKDGMDISLCSIKNNTLKWAGANNPIWIIRQGELIEIKADKQPIGKYGELKKFTTHEMQLQKGDVIYISTDGFQDQFGGENGKKLNASNFKKILLSIQHLAMEMQKKEIDKAFETWKGSQEQVDDVCVIGLKV